MQNSILVPVDLSETTGATLAVAEDLARSLGARIYLVHAAGLAQPFAATEFGLAVTREDLAKELKGEHRRIKELEDQVRARGLDVCGLLLQGDPVDSILREAKRLDPRLIVMGSHGHGALYHLLLGSTSEGVLRKATCPIVLVPCRKPEPKDQTKVEPTSSVTSA